MTVRTTLVPGVPWPARDAHVEAKPAKPKRPAVSTSNVWRAPRQSKDIRLDQFLLADTALQDLRNKRPRVHLNLKKEKQ